MADTANFGWTKPTVAGSSSIWGGILNTALDDIDTDLQVVLDAAAAAQADADLGVLAAAENLSFPLILAARGNSDEIGNEGNVPWFTIVGRVISGGTKTPTVTHAANSGLGHRWVIPIPDLKVGMRITGFKSYGDRGDSSADSVSLGYYSTSGAFTQVSAGHQLSVAYGEASTTGLTHDVLADKMYCIVYTDGDPTVVQGWLAFVQPIVIRTP